jgi:hypothetical protein
MVPLAVTIGSVTHSNFLPILCSQLDKLLGTVYKYLVLTQPIHSKSDIYAL